MPAEARISVASANAKKPVWQRATIDNMKRVGGIRRNGFTIVELLIIIVVIAIIAAITIVAFNSVQQRAENTKTHQAVSQFTKALTLYAQENAVYPTPISPGGWYCLPVDSTYCLSSSNSPTPSCFGLNLTNYPHTTFYSMLNTVVKSLPQVSNKPTECSNGRTFLGAVARIYNDGHDAQIHFGQAGDVSCPSVSGTSSGGRSVEVNTTRCVATLPTLP